jgi:hypothetical protein
VSIPLKTGARFTSPFTERVSSSLSGSITAVIAARDPFLSHPCSSRHDSRLCHFAGSGNLTRRYEEPPNGEDAAGYRASEHEAQFVSWKSARSR